MVEKLKVKMFMVEIYRVKKFMFEMFEVPFILWVEKFGVEMSCILFIA